MLLYGPAPKPHAWLNPWSTEDLKKNIHEKNSYSRYKQDFSGVTYL